MTDGRNFNVLDSNGRLLCPACGFPDYSDEPAYDESGGIIATTICPCCFWEPGFDDEPNASATAKETILESLRAYRAQWGGAGSTWRGRETEKPTDWNGEAQLASLFETAPTVR